MKKKQRHTTTFRHRIVLTIFATLGFFSILGTVQSCAGRPADIMLYVMFNDVRYIDLIINQFNSTQKKYKVEYRAITPNMLESVLNNKIDRENLFLLIADHTIVKRAKDNFLLPMFPAYEKDFNKKDLVSVAEKVLTYTENYGFPLYFYNIENNEAETAVISLVREGYYPDKLPVMLDFFHFISQPEVNAQALFFDHIPVYTNAHYDTLAESEKKRVDKTVFPKSFVAKNLSILDSVEIVRYYENE